MSATVPLFKEPQGVLMNGAALLYAGAGYVVGFAGLFHDSWAVNAVATLLLAHAMVIAAYVIHECAHNLVFSRARHNAALGRAMSWLCGAAYGTYEDIRYKHFRHHVDNDDVVWFEYEKFFQRHPLVLRLVRALEWLYVPAHDLVMHFVMVFTSFIIPERRAQRRRNVTVILLRGGVFLLLLAFVPKVACLYVVAYLLMMHVLRFMDALQHDYPYNATLFDYVLPPHKGDDAREQERAAAPAPAVANDLQAAVEEAMLRERKKTLLWLWDLLKVTNQLHGAMLTNVSFVSHVTNLVFEPMLMMWPLFRARIPGRTLRISAANEKKLVSNMSRISCSSPSSTAASPSSTRRRRGR